MKAVPLAVDRAQGGPLNPKANASASETDNTAKGPDTAVNLRCRVALHRYPIVHKSLIQMATSFGGYFATCGAMYALAHVSIWLSLLLAPLAGGFLMRIFVIQHDCGHRSFFRHRLANGTVGLFCSLLTMTPFASWRRQHAGHHNTWNNIDRRESGIDIYSSCLTVAEYRAKGPLDRALYRASRHPLFANLLLPPFIFTLLYRFPFDIPKSWNRERRAVHVTTVGLVVVLAGLCWMLGYQQVAAVQLSGLSFAAIVGTCMFSVQHRGVRTHWFRERAWNRTDAAMEGTTYLELPAVLHWFTGNIGFHHIHHLNPAVPNYRLKECHEQIASLREMPTMSLLGALRGIQLALWDEKQGRMVSFSAAASDATA